MDHAILRDPRLLAELAARLDGGRDPDTLLAREVARYYGLLARELAAVQLTREEASVLQVAVRGTDRARIAGSPFGSLAEAVAAEVRRTEDLPARRVVDGEKLVAEVATWSSARTVAVLDACERVRAVAHRGGSATLTELLRADGPPRSGSGRRWRRRGAASRDALGALERLLVRLERGRWPELGRRTRPVHGRRA